jgi:hypothetical protein
MDFFNGMLQVEGMKSIVNSEERELLADVDAVERQAQAKSPRNV